MTRRRPPLVSLAKPLVGHLPELQRSPETLLWRGYAEHGLVFSIAMARMPGVVLLGEKNNKLFFDESDRRLSIRDSYRFYQWMFSPDFYYLAEGWKYRWQRELVVPRLQGGQLATYVGIMDEHARRFVAELGQRGEIGLTSELGPVQLRIAASCFLGSDFAERMDGDFFKVFRDFSEGTVYLPGWMPLPAVIRSRRARERLRTSIGAIIRDRREHPLASADFLQLMAAATYPDGSQVEDLVLINLVLLFLWSGHETTTGHLAWALADLIANPEALERAREEASAALSAGSLDLAALAGLTYLENCLRESERLHPIAFLQARTALEDIEVDGYTIPRGAKVMNCPIISHRLADEYERPNDYWPDRFTRPEHGKAERLGLIGFGGGLHKCIGMRFALIEMKVFLARLLTSYDFELVGGFPVPVSGLRTKWPAEPCRVSYQARR